MRTVVFSDAKVAKLLGKSFVCAWVNQTPQTRFKDGLYLDKKEPLGLRNGAGAGNVASVFAAHDGLVIHSVDGYLDPPTFIRHAEFARDLHDRMYEGVGLRQFAALIYSEAHLDEAKASKDETGRLAHLRLAKSKLTNVRESYEYRLLQREEKT